MTKFLFISLICLGFSFILPVFALAETEALTVVTRQAENITSSSANLKGEVIEYGEYNEITTWFEYGQDTSYDKSTARKGRYGTGYFSKEILGLKLCTIYHFRAVAENWAKTSYGEPQTFTTKCPASFIKVLKFAKNLSDGEKKWNKTIFAEPNEDLEFKIELTNTGNVTAVDVLVQDNLPKEIIYQGNLNLSSGIDIGNIYPGQTKVITFRAALASKSHFTGLSNRINNFATVSGKNIPIKSGLAIINIEKGISPTAISTGQTNFLFPLFYFFPITSLMSALFITILYVLLLPGLKKILAKALLKSRNQKLKKLLAFLVS